LLLAVKLPVRVFWLTVSCAEPLLLLNVASPANDAETPVAYVPAAIPVRLALAMVATPDEFVVAEPTDVPLSENATVLPLSPPPPDVMVSVAETLAVPPYVPAAEAAVSVVDRVVTPRSVAPPLLANEPAAPP
jgi:hypothetical protein